MSSAGESFASAPGGTWIEPPCEIQLGARDDHEQRQSLRRAAIANAHLTGYLARAMTSDQSYPVFVKIAAEAESSGCAMQHRSVDVPTNISGLLLPHHQAAAKAR